MTECKPKPFEFHPLSSREVVAQFDGGDITSDAGGLMLREVEERTGILKEFGSCFVDYRNAESIEHPVEDLVAQRAYGLCLGYEDLNDHDELRADPMLAVMVGKKDPKGEHRREPRDRGKALAGKSTLNRLELTRADAGPSERYKKIVMSDRSVDDRSFPGGARECTTADHFRFGCHGRSDSRTSGGTVLSRLLRLLLLSAVVHFLW